MFVFEFLGTVAFAISGALKGVRKQLDIFGIIILALTTALGGGMVRDVVIGNIPPLALRNNILVVTAIGGGLLVFCLNRLLKEHISRQRRVARLSVTIQLSDAVGLGAFAVAGAETAVYYGQNNLLTIMFLSVSTAVGGGILRDLFIQEIPEVFRREIYAVAALLGALVYATMGWLGVEGGDLACFGVTVGLRLIAIKYKLNLPRPL